MGNEVVENKGKEEKQTKQLKRVKQEKQSEQTKLTKLSKKCKFSIPNYVLIVLITICFSVVSGIYYKLSGNDQIQLLMAGLIGSGFLIFEMAFSRLYHTFYYNNEEHEGRFIIVFLCCFVLAVSLPLFPISGWPYLFIALILSLFSNALIGTLSFSMLLMITSILSNAGTDSFFLYFMCGIFTIILFSKLDESYRIGIPIFLSLLVFFVLNISNIAINMNKDTQAEMFIIPFINIFLNGLLMNITLKFFSLYVVHKHRDSYMTINDPEYALLVELKNTKKSAYYHAIHTSYLSDKIARRLHADADAARACGYYAKAYKYRNQTLPEYVNQIRKEFAFPEPTCKVIEELNDSSGKLYSKEAIIVYMSDTVVEAISYLFDKDPEAALNYHEIIELIFKKKIDKGLFDVCALTMGELLEMKKIFMEETLYYDFLR